MASRVRNVLLVEILLTKEQPGTIQSDNLLGHDVIQRIDYNREVELV